MPPKNRSHNRSQKHRTKQGKEQNKHTFDDALGTQKLFPKEILESIERFRKEFYTDEKLKRLDEDFNIPTYYDYVPLYKIIGYKYGWNFSTWGSRKSIYFSANEAYKQFAEDGDFKNILFAISNLKSESLRCPVMISVLSHLRIEYITALQVGNKKAIEEIEKIASKIGYALLDIDDNKKYYVQYKVALLIRRLHIVLYKKRKKKKIKATSIKTTNLQIFPEKYPPHRYWYTTENYQKVRNISILRGDVIRYIDKIYNYYKKKAINNKKAEDTLIEKMSKEKMNNLKRESRKFSKRLETIASTQAMNDTINRLENETGVRIEKRSLKDILAVINSLKKEERIS